VKLRIGQRVGIRPTLRGEHGFGIITGIKQRRGANPLVTLWARFGRGYWGYEHLDAGHLVSFARTARWIREDSEALIRAARTVKPPVEI
jgi:hypothetical protein